MSNLDPNAGMVPVWDPLVRVFHWSLAATFAVAYLSGESNYALHLWAGYGLLGLIAIRLVWGFAGTPHARFRDFVVGPRRAVVYLTDVVRGQATRYLGHNPAGAAMILALLATLLAASASGIMLDGAENRAGPLADYRLFMYTDTIKQVHLLSTDVALALILLHLAGVAHASLTHRENLVRAMVTGRKPLQLPVRAGAAASPRHGASASGPEGTA